MERARERAVRVRVVKREGARELLSVSEWDPEV